ncbi:hypothetical protein CCACVL1_18076 [Corchorus capsularis]|uniref:Uncharacterized protein n=1 Tax=Corchorus capsularis TaxID=210143 RepID=A0A1R3HMZ6_COCAP|nr:hypothetical protein CCACVL1_18076 [Corchorus capsularis]
MKAVIAVTLVAGCVKDVLAGIANSLFLSLLTELISKVAIKVVEYK